MKRLWDWLRRLVRGDEPAPVATPPAPVVPVPDLPPVAVPVAVPEPAPVVVTPAPPAPPPPEPPLAWGARVSPAFRQRVREIAAELGCDPSDLMACMAFESGETFSPSIRNAAGSGATGLIQFMPSTARALGTTTDALARMTALQQLEYVRRYFLPHKGRLKTLADLYMAILWPAAVGKLDSHPLFVGPGITYRQNAGLDRDRNGVVTKGEAAAIVALRLAKGLRAPNVWPTTGVTA